MIDKIFAKSKENGKIKLVEHSIAVINVSVYLFNQIIKKEINFNDVGKENIDKFYNELILTAALHDIGKCSRKFQERLNNFNSTEDGNYVPKSKKETNSFICHNVAGWAYLEYYYENIPDIVKNNILYHHTVNPSIGKMTVLDIVSDDDMKDSKDNYDEFYNYIIQYCNNKYNLINKIKFKDSYDNSDKIIDSVSLYRQIKPSSHLFFTMMDDASKFLIIRSIIVFADRFVSENYDKISLIRDNNEDFFRKEILNKVIDSRKGWNDNVNELKDDKGNLSYDTVRLKEQNSLLNDIEKYSNNIVSASAGFGKTLVGLRWILRNKKKVMWIVPRNVIADGTYQSICNERNKMGYTEDNLSIGLLIAGQWVKGNIDSDIIVTNIDNFLSMMIKNCMVNNLIKEIGCNIIFDEYHEFLSHQELFAGFIELVYARCKFTNSKTLLLSATPLRFDKTYFNDGEMNVHFLKAKAYNGEMKVKVNFFDLNDINYLPSTVRDSFIICNTVKQSQRLFKLIGGKDDILIHSRFPSVRRNEIEEEIYHCHGKGSCVNNRNNIIGTNIIGVGLDISAKTIYDFVVTPENTIQRGCGRGGRFNEKEYNNEIIYNVCNLINDKGNRMLINSQTNNNLHDKWLKILKSFDGLTITKDKLYELYYDFYDENKKEIAQLWNHFLDESSRKLMNLRPYKTFTKQKENIKNRLSDRQSYRGIGNSVFVTVQNADDTYSEAIIIDRNYICKEEFSLKSLKNKKKYFERCIRLKDNKYKAKNTLLVDKEEMFRQALNEDTPLLLEYSTYDSLYGLSLNVLNERQDTYEEEID